MKKTIARFAGLVIVMGLVFGLAGAAPQADAAKTTVKVKVDAKTLSTGGQFPIGMVAAPNGLLYVLDHIKPMVTVVNPKTGKLVKKITLTSAQTFEQNAIAVAGNKVYVLDGYLNRIYVIDTKKNKRIKTVALPKSDDFEDPEVMTASKDGKKLYIGAHYGTYVRAFDTKTNKLTTKYSLSKAIKLFPGLAEVTAIQVTDIELSSNGRYLFLALMGGFGGDSFSLTGIMDTKTKKLTALDPTKDHPWGKPNTEYYDMINIGKDKVYRSVSTEKTDGDPFVVEVLDLSNPKKIKKIDTIPMPKNNIPYRFNYSKGYLFVTNPANDGFTKYPTSPDTVQIVDTAKKGKSAVVGSFKSKKTMLLEGKLSKDGKTIYYLSGGDDDPSWKGQISVAHLTFPKTVKYAKVTGAYVVKLHSKASMSAKVAGYVHKGDKVQVLSTTKTGWVKIKHGKKTGYLPRKFLK